MRPQGSCRLVLGTGVVNKVYDQFILLAGISEASKEDVKQAAAAKQNVFMRGIKTLGDIFVPIIPAIVASGFLMGIMEAMNFMVNNGFLSINTDGSLYQFAVLFSNVAYVFLPILIAFSAARTFGANPFLGAVIGMIMIHPNLQNAWTVATEGVLSTQPVFFGLYSIKMVGYQGHVIPVIIAVWVLAFIEKRLHKLVPAMLDLFVTPLVSVFVTGYLTLAVIGPVFRYLGKWDSGRNSVAVNSSIWTGKSCYGRRLRYNSSIRNSSYVHSNRLRTAVKIWFKPSGCP